MQLLLFMLLASITASAAGDTNKVVNQWGMTFVAIPSGQFMMGTKDIDEAAMEHPKGDVNLVRDETPPHPVSISAFYMGQTEVTQKQWQDVMNSQPGPEANWQRKDWQQLPVVTVNWHRIQDFINVLNAKDEQYHYRLPTEAEWEYVARDGSGSLRPFDIEQLDEHAWTISNSGDILHPVATRKANGFDIYDLYGNVWEWVNDWYAPDYYTNSAQVDPPGPDKGTRRMRRGGSFHCPVHLIRPGYRAPEIPDKRYSVLGFRLAASPHPVPCTEPWYAFVESKVSTGDGMGHGPDADSAEWKSVVEFKLGIRGTAGIPDPSTDEWCNYIDKQIR